MKEKKLQRIVKKKGKFINANTNKIIDPNPEPLGEPINCAVYSRNSRVDPSDPYRWNRFMPSRIDFGPYSLHGRNEILSGANAYSVIEGTIREKSTDYGSEISPGGNPEILGKIGSGQVQFYRIPISDETQCEDASKGNLEELVLDSNGIPKRYGEPVLIHRFLPSSIDVYGLGGENLKTEDEIIKSEIVESGHRPEWANSYVTGEPMIFMGIKQVPVFYLECRVAEPGNIKESKNE